MWGLLNEKSDNNVRFKKKYAIATIIHKKSDDFLIIIIMNNGIITYLIKIKIKTTSLIKKAWKTNKIGVKNKNSLIKLFFMNDLF